LKKKVYVMEVGDPRGLINCIDVAAAEIKNLPRQLVTDKESLLRGNEACVLVET
jgi:hypothetical protein